MLFRTASGSSMARNRQRDQWFSVVVTLAEGVHSAPAH